MSRVTERRGSGVLLHPTSFPGGPVGTLGDEAYRFVDWLRAAGQSRWQVLPLVPVDEGGSPYSGLSAMAGNTMLLDAALLVRDGVLEPRDAAASDEERVDFAAALKAADRLVHRAHHSLHHGAAASLRHEFDGYRERQRRWLADFALFRALRDAYGSPWTKWKAGLRSRRPDALRRARARFATEIERHAFGQFLFDRQWHALREYARRAGVRIIGDIPIFVAHDSADVWAHPKLFALDDRGAPTVVSGVPPDYFSATGQRWGNPLYRWAAIRRDRYRWWIERFRRTLEMVDVARIDHFRGFESYWEIPATEETALHGQWVAGPGAALFTAAERELGPLPLIAEDLGIITPEVDALRHELDMPGMRVLQFAFGGDARNPHLPANYTRDTVAYTGTHDNNTSAGWYAEASDGERAALRELTSARDAHWGMMELVFRSPAALAVAPLQDVLGLGSGDRMNTPGTGKGNWGWRLRPGELTPELAARLLELTRSTERLHGEHES
ncbi:MAG TPA: 4-alpha-glucanotransferase [Longimicrobium sp.]|nr:4-alpha-glucanotransferase [Longimicrobium sp.]